MQARILVVDDDPSVRRLLALRLGNAGYDVKSVNDGETALGAIPEFQPHLVLADMLMPGMDGMDLFAAIRKNHAGLPVIILTAHGTIPDAVEATRRGVFGYITKPFESKSLLEWIEKALAVGGGGSKSEPGSTLGRRWREDIITRNADMEGLLRQTVMTAISDAPILLEGEFGTGKSLLARAIHRARARRDKPFIAANAAVIPESLVEAEFLGHDSDQAGGGASHDGLIRAADGGTLYISEIDALPLVFQETLLAVLQDHKLRPIGSRRPVPVDIRLISASRGELRQSVSRGVFSQELYYDINVTPLRVPALADRREDIPLLAAHFLAGAAERASKIITGFSPQAMERLVGAPWPGNVSQLKNVVERAAALTDTPLIPEDIVQRARDDRRDEQLGSLTAARDQFERDYLVQLLTIARGNVSRAARIAGRNRTEFYKLLHRHKLDPRNFRDDAL